MESCVRANKDGRRFLIRFGDDMDDDLGGVGLPLLS